MDSVVSGGVALTPPREYLDALAELAVDVGANLQPGQMVGITVQSGQEPMARAVAEKAYARGARYVDLWLVDLFVKHSRLKHAGVETLDYVPDWTRERMLALGEMNAARFTFQGPPQPHLMDDIAPERLGMDTLPRLRESTLVTGMRTTNWTITPFPNPEWAKLVHPDLAVEQAYAKLWEQVAWICRLTEPDPAAAWSARLAELESHAARLNELRLDALQFTGPGTDLRVGLLPSSIWKSGRDQTVGGLEFVANLPTEEVFTAPDPERVEGVVRATKPLLIPGSSAIEGLEVRFQGGRVVSIEASKGAEILRGFTSRDEGASRLGEVALVDREGRVGRSGSVFYDILLDENSASHIAVGDAYLDNVGDQADQARANRSTIHIDFMIGSEEVAVDGLRADGSVLPLLRGGAWQI